MGYSTYFSGELTIEPPLTTEQLLGLNLFTERRHEENESTPGYYCGWEATAPDVLQWNESEKFYDYIDWLVYLIHRFFEPWGRTLTGEIHWDGEENDDMGRIEVIANQVRIYEAVISYDKLTYVAYGGSTAPQETPA